MGKSVLEFLLGVRKETLRYDNEEAYPGEGLVPLGSWNSSYPIPRISVSSMSGDDQCKRWLFAICILSWKYTDDT